MHWSLIEGASLLASSSPWILVLFFRRYLKLLVFLGNSLLLGFDRPRLPLELLLFLFILILLLKQLQLLKTLLLFVHVVNEKTDDSSKTKDSHHDTDYQCRIGASTIAT
jgi:hypothetical protein